MKSKKENICEPIGDILLNGSEESRASHMVRSYLLENISMCFPSVFLHTDAKTDGFLLWLHTQPVDGAIMMPVCITGQEPAVIKDTVAFLWTFISYIKYFLISYGNNQSVHINI